MTRTFLVEVEVDSITPEALEEDAQDIFDMLNTHLYVTSVKPWAAPQQANEPLLPLPQTLG